MGILKIKGTINLNQFWPLGKSDADTTKIKVNIDDNSFLYKSDHSIDYSSTEIFKKAFGKGEGKPTPVIKNLKRGKPHVNIRLQGIDAPELHYRMYGSVPEKVIKKTKMTKLSTKEYDKLKKVNAAGEYRQSFAETATVKLSEYLRSKTTNQEQIPCTFISQNVNKPSDVCDIYGRFVGDILIDNERINVNHWLLEQGWVFPAIYDSMLDPEIDEIIRLFVKGKDLPGSTLQSYTVKVTKFDYAKQFREPQEKPRVSAAKDKGKVIFPKIYRRLCIYSIYKKAGINLGTFKVYLQTKDDSDRIVLRKDLSGYRINQKTRLSLSMIYKDDKLIESPENIVFIEKPSVLVDRDGGEIKIFS